MKQTQMFDTEDLPLFSGTAQRAKLNSFEAREQPRQESLPTNCHFCQDTGTLGEYAFCWCEAGQDRKARKEKPQ